MDPQRVSHLLWSPRYLLHSLHLGKPVHFGYTHVFIVVNDEISNAAAGYFVNVTGSSCYFCQYPDTTVMPHHGAFLYPFCGLLLYWANHLMTTNKGHSWQTPGRYCSGNSKPTAGIYLSCCVIAMMNKYGATHGWGKPNVSTFCNWIHWSTPIKITLVLSLCFFSFAQKFAWSHSPQYFGTHCFGTRSIDVLISAQWHRLSFRVVVIALLKFVQAYVMINCEM